MSFCFSIDLRSEGVQAMTNSVSEVVQAAALGFVLWVVVGWGGICFGLVLALVAWMRRARQAALVGSICLGLAWPVYVFSFSLRDLARGVPAGGVEWLLFAFVLMGPAWLAVLIPNIILACWSRKATPAPIPGARSSVGRLQ